MNNGLLASNGAKRDRSSEPVVVALTPAIRLRDGQMPACFITAADSSNAMAMTEKPKTTSASTPTAMSGPKYIQAAARKSERGWEGECTVSLFNGA